jgi:hypothetical protein
LNYLQKIKDGKLIIYLVILPFFILQTTNVIDREVLAQKEIDNEFYINTLSHLPIPVIVGLIAALAVIVSGITTAFLKNKSDIEIDIRKTLRQKRIEIYSKLFSYMETFSVFNSLSPKLKKYDELLLIQDSITKWYYLEKGGLFMSYSSQKAYVNFQLIVKEIINGKKEIYLSEDSREKIKIMGYMLRLKLLEDVGIDVFKAMPFYRWSRLKYLFLKYFKESGEYDALVKSYYDFFGSDKINRIIENSIQNQKSKNQGKKLDYYYHEINNLNTNNLQENGKTLKDNLTNINNSRNDIEQQYTRGKINKEQFDKLADDLSKKYRDF